eukprot:6206479-Pleurochrysis_carterae.AAC.1
MHKHLLCPQSRHTPQESELWSREPSVRIALQFHLRTARKCSSPEYSSPSNQKSARGVARVVHGFMHVGKVATETRRRGITAHSLYSRRKAGRIPVHLNNCSTISPR